MKKQTLARLVLLAHIWTSSIHTKTEELDQKPMVIISCSYNNEKFCDESLTSILNQDYDNFRVIYIDDCSTDKTNEKVRQITNKHPKGPLVELIRNPHNCGAMANLYHAIHTCKPNEIVVLVDGDDFLPHTEVLKTVNEYYTKEDLWLTYGNYSTIRTEKTGQWSKPLDMEIIQKKGFRKHPWATSHLHTFYAGLFHQIKLHDLIKNGVFFTATYDQAITLPMLECALGHIKYLPDVLYLHNDLNPLSNKSGLEYRLAQYIRSLPVYAPLKKDPRDGIAYEGESCEMIIISDDSPAHLDSLLASNTLSSMNVTIFYTSRNKKSADAYANITRTYPLYNFTQYAQDNFKTSLLEHIAASSDNGSEYIILCTNIENSTTSLDIESSIVALKKTGAYCYFLNTPKIEASKQKSIDVDGTIRAYQFSTGANNFFGNNALSMTLYAKGRILKDLNKIQFQDPLTLKKTWEAVINKRYLGIH